MYCHHDNKLTGLMLITNTLNKTVSEIPCMFSKSHRIIYFKPLLRFYLTMCWQLIDRDPHIGNAEGNCGRFCIKLENQYSMITIDVINWHILSTQIYESNLQFGSCNEVEYDIHNSNWSQHIIKLCIRWYGSKW